MVSESVPDQHLVFIAIRPDKTKLLRISIQGSLFRDGSTYNEFSIDQNTMKVEIQKKVPGLKSTVQELGRFQDLDLFMTICENQPVPGEIRGSSVLATITSWLNYIPIFNRIYINQPAPVPAASDDVFDRWVSDVLAKISAHHSELWDRIDYI